MFTQTQHTHTQYTHTHTYKHYRIVDLTELPTRRKGRPLPAGLARREAAEVLWSRVEGGGLSTTTTEALVSLAMDDVTAGAAREAGLKLTVGGT